MKLLTPVLSEQKQPDPIVALNWLAVLFWAILAVGAVCCFYLIQNSAGQGEPFAWFDGTSAWPSIAIILFAAFLSVHLIVKTHLDLRQNAAQLGEEFGIARNRDRIDIITLWKRYHLQFGLRNLISEKTSLFRGLVYPEAARIGDRIDIVALWELYLYRGRFWRRVVRAAPMTVLYIAALVSIMPLIGHFPTSPIRGEFPFHVLIGITICAFLFLTFFVIDAILLHEGFLLQLERKETYWPDATFLRFKYPIKPNRPSNESDLADYWDILLISKRTEAVGRLIYYPFVILSLLIVARLSCFDNWTWTPPLIAALSMHFLLALYAAWRLPKVATLYRDKVLERLRRRRRQALLHAEKIPEAIDTMIEEVQSTHQGAFSYLWEQPAIRALLLPSSGVGLATLLQYLPH
jgi:hypothetical protein